MNVGYIEWESLPDDVNTRAAALLQLLSSELGPVDSWQRVGPPSRAPGSLVADAEAAQAAAAAEQRQQLLHQQRGIMLNGWKPAGLASSSASASPRMSLYGAAPSSTFVPALLSGPQVPVSAAGFGPSVDYTGTWGAAASGAANPTSLGFATWGSDGLGMVSMPGALATWGSGALAGGSGLGAAPRPSLLQQLSNLQQQMQQQQAWDALVAAEELLGRAGAASRSEDGAGLLSAQDRAASVDAAGSSTAGGAVSVPPSPASGVQASSAATITPAGPDALPGAEELQAALAKAQQKWNSSPSSTQGSAGSGGSNCRKAAAFMWGDPTTASIWAP